jgi:hypothetical protein
MTTCSSNSRCQRQRAWAAKKGDATDATLLCGALGVAFTPKRGAWVRPLFVLERGAFGTDSKMQRSTLRQFLDGCAIVQ